MRREKSGEQAAIERLSHQARRRPIVNVKAMPGAEPKSRPRIAPVIVEGKLPNGICEDNADNVRSKNNKTGIMLSETFHDIRVH